MEQLAALLSQGKKRQIRHAMSHYIPVPGCTPNSVALTNTPFALRKAVDLK